jgi:hypothetical protein
MRQAAFAFVSLALWAAAGAAPQGPGEPPYGGISPAAGRIYHVEYLRAFPGKSDDYDRFVKTVFRPMLDAMVARGIWIKYGFLTVPYHGPSPCTDYTHIFVAQLQGFAALDREQKAWSEVQKKFHPDEEDLPKIREMVDLEVINSAPRRSSAGPPRRIPPLFRGRAPRSAA